jgi:hypothetical protein
MMLADANFGAYFKRGRRETYFVSRAAVPAGVHPGVTGVNWRFPP